MVNAEDQGRTFDILLQYDCKWTEQDGFDDGAGSRVFGSNKPSLRNISKNIRNTRLRNLPDQGGYTLEYVLVEIGVARVLRNDTQDCNQTLQQARECAGEGFSGSDYDSGNTCKANFSIRPLQ